MLYLYIQKLNNSLFRGTLSPILFLMFGILVQGCNFSDTMPQTQEMKQQKSVVRDVIKYRIEEYLECVPVEKVIVEEYIEMVPYGTEYRAEKSTRARKVVDFKEVIKYRQVAYVDKETI